MHLLKILKFCSKELGHIVNDPNRIYIPPSAEPVSLDQELNYSNETNVNSSTQFSCSPRPNAFFQPVPAALESVENTPESVIIGLNGKPLKMNKHAADMRKYRAKNPDKANEDARKWYNTHKTEYNEHRKNIKRKKTKTSKL